MTGFRTNDSRAPKDCVDCGGWPADHISPDGQRRCGECDERLRAARATGEDQSDTGRQ